MFEHAINPLDCLTGHGIDTPFWPWLMWWLALINGALYLVIVRRWWLIFSDSLFQRLLMLIFGLCTICGYWTLNLSYFWPGMAYSLRVVSLAVLVIVDLYFIRITKGMKFHAELSAVQEQQRKAYSHSLQNVEKQIRLTTEIRRHAVELRRVIDD